MVPNCCLVISVVYLGKEYNLNIYPDYHDTGEIVNYYFSINEEFTLNIEYNDGTWFITNPLDGNDYYSIETTSCPVGSSDLWTSLFGEEPVFDSFEIFDTGCGGPTEDVVVEIEIDNTVYNPCKYKNALIKGKRGLAEDVAKLSNYETFGLEGCEDKWSTAIAKYLAIDALKCPPYGVYTETDERCLISKIATNYKC